MRKRVIPSTIPSRNSNEEVFVLHESEANEQS